MKQKEKSKQSKEKIMKAAFSLFASKGYETTTTQDIIDLAELSRGAMYHHFKSKEDILKSVTKDFEMQMDTLLKRLVEEHTLTAKEKISKLLAYSIEKYEQKQVASSFWVEKVPFALLEDIRYSNNHVAFYLSEILKQGIENGEFVCSYPQELSELLVLCVDIWLDTALFKRSYEEICRRMDFIMVLLEKLQIPVIDEEDIKNLKATFHKQCGSNTVEVTT